MRFSVECAFPHLGKRGAALRKGAFCLRVSPKSALCVRAATHTAPFREARLRTEICGSPRKPPRRLAGGLLERICPVEAFSIVPRSLAGGLPHTSRAPRRDGKAHSGHGSSRKGAFCEPRTNQTALFREALVAERAFP